MSILTFFYKFFRFKFTKYVILKFLKPSLVTLPRIILFIVTFSCSMLSSEFITDEVNPEYTVPPQTKFYCFCRICSDAPAEGAQ